MTGGGTDNYKQSLKATSIFGGVQFYTILITAVRSKFIALLLGPVGMGINGLLTITIGIVSSISQLGIGTSAVREMSKAYTAGNEDQLAYIVSVFRKLIWFTGSLGLLLCMAFSPLLSLWTFGNYEYTPHFIALSVTLLLAQLTIGKNSVMQVFRRYTLMGKASVVGATIGLFTTVPIYYWLGINGIVPALIVTAMVTFLLAWHFSRKIEVRKVSLSLKEVFVEGNVMVKMGFFLTLKGMFELLFAYFVRIYVGHVGEMEQVGLYTAGFSIVNTYVGLVFTAMTTDYYPRLSGVAHEDAKYSSTVNDQLEISLLILAPIIIAFIVYVRPLVLLLYSSKFIPAEGMIYWAIFAIFFKAVGWCIAMSFLAKGDTKTLFLNELAAGIVMTGMNIAGYEIWGITGLGISFFAGYLLYLLQVWIICHKKYNLQIVFSSFRFLLIQIAMALVCMGLVMWGNPFALYGAGTLLIVASLFYSYKMLDRKILISKIIKSKLRKK